MSSRLASVSLAALLAGTIAAAAQEIPALVEIEDDDAVVTVLEMTVDEVEDMDVVDAAGETIGEVEEVLGTPEGDPAALAIEVGGFLGIGARDAIVSLDQFAIIDDELVLDLTKEEIESLPVWED